MDKVKFPFILGESQERAVRMAFIDFKIFLLDLFRERILLMNLRFLK